MHWLNSAEASEHLRLGERKLYELVASGQIPCSKVTGRWLFAREALDRWVLAGVCGPAAAVAAEPPLIVGGSQDDLLEWCLRQSGSGFATLFEGTEAGLGKLLRGDVSAAAIHFHGDTEDENVERVRGTPGFHDALIVGFARREQGLVLPSGNPDGVASFADLSAKDLVVAARQEGAGARMLLDRLAAREGAVRHLGQPCLRGADVADAVRAGEAQAGIAQRAVAKAAGLDFVPLVWERFDLVLRQRTFFGAPFQALVAFLDGGRAAERAASLGGYDLSPAGTIRHFA